MCTLLSRLAATPLLVALLLAVPAAAQPSPPAGDLAPDPLRVDGLGLQVYPPDLAVIQVQRVEERVAVTMVDGNPERRWSMRIQKLTASQPGTTPAEQVEHLLETWRRANRPFTMISNDAVTYAGRASRICYVSQPATPGVPGGAAPTEVVSGWLVVGLGEWEFLVFSLQIVPEAFDGTRRLFEKSFATLRISDLGEIVDDRKIRLDMGKALLGRIGPDDLARLVGTSAWYRYYVPAELDAAGVERELGYYHIVFSEDSLGAIDPSRPVENYDTSEEVRGLMVTVLGHYLAAEGSSYDSEARFWLSWERDQEAWSIVGTRRYGGNAQSDALTGIRAPRTATAPQGLITVINSTRSGATRDQRSWSVPDVYLSQASRWALGALLPRDGTEPIEFSAYCVDTPPGGIMPKLSLRIDRWEPAPDRAGYWLLSSRPRSDAPVTKSLYDPSGHLVRRTFANGPVSERIELDALHRIWKDKGLPTGPSRPGLGGRKR